MDDVSGSEWATAFLSHRPFVERLARDLVRDSHVAEDLVQETWLVAVKESPRKLDSTRAWLATVLRNRALDMYRKEGLRKAHEDSTSRAEIAGGWDPTGDEEQEEIRTRLEQALRALPPKYCEVLELRYFEGLGPTDISERLGLPLETVRTRSKRALHMLRESLTREYGQDTRAWVLALASLAATMESSRSFGSLLPVASVLVALLVGVVSWYAWSGSSALDSSVAARDRPELEAFKVLDEGDSFGQRRSAQDTAPVPPSVSPRGFGAWVFDSSGTPIEGFEILLQGEADAGWSGELRVARTDADGWADLARLEPGVWTLRPERGPARRVEVARGREPVRFEAPGGVRVRGRVVDREGSAQAGAHVVATWPSFDQRLRVVGISDPDGHFEIPELDRLVWFGVQSDAGSTRLESLDTPRHRQEDVLEFAFESPLARAPLAGHVLDSGGRPLAGVTIRPVHVSLSNGFSQSYSADGRASIAAIHRSVVSGVDGGFELLDRPGTGPVRLTLTKSGYVPMRVRLGDRQEPFEPRMQREAVVEGRVLAGDGEPAAGVLVTAPIPGFINPRSTRSDAAGRFRLDGLPSGELHLGARGERVGSLGCADSALFANPGARLEWNPVLVQDRAIRGRALAADSSALVGWTVVLRPERRFGRRKRVAWIEDERWLRRTIVREDGSFVFYGCDPEDHQLQLFSPEDDLVPHHVRFGVQPEQDEVLLRSQDAGGSSAIRGRLVSSAPIEGALILLYSKSVGRRLRIPVTQEGSFERASLPPGEYIVEAWVPPWPPIPSARVVLEAGALTSCELDLPEPGAVEVEVVDASGRPLDDYYLRLRSKETDFLAAGRGDGGGRGVEVSEDATSRIGRLLPGEYQLEVSRADHVSRTEIVVGSGRCSRTRIVLP